jgi:hypothetical protein
LVQPVCQVGTLAAHLGVLRQANGLVPLVPVAAKANGPKRPLNRSNRGKSRQNATSTEIGRSTQIPQISIEDAGFSIVRPHIRRGFA